MILTISGFHYFQGNGGQLAVTRVSNYICSVDVMVLPCCIILLCQAADDFTCQGESTGAEWVNCLYI
jgi:hypothetical protein